MSREQDLSRDHFILQVKQQAQPARDESAVRSWASGLPPRALFTLFVLPVSGSLRSICSMHNAVLDADLPPSF